jgi:hypothetical protein
MKDVIPQLWFSQTEHLSVAYRHEGVIAQEPTRYDMAAQFEAWEAQHEEQLQKLVGLIQRIRDALERTGARSACWFIAMLRGRGRWGFIGWRRGGWWRCLVGKGDVGGGVEMR